MVDKPAKRRRPRGSGRVVVQEVPSEVARLPSVDSVLAQDEVQALLQRLPRSLVLGSIRRILAGRREGLRSQQTEWMPFMAEVHAADIERENACFMRPPLRPVINASGVVVHTNLGRAPLPAAAVQAIADIAGSYCNLEMDLERGTRGSRGRMIKDLLLERTGAEDALVVNNNAAAVYLALRALAKDREVVVSRGELVEIGGSFRIPDVMAASGARLVEVGCTNKTRLDDYRKVIGPDTAMILKVHRSNFEMIGFTEEAELAALVELAHSQGLLLVVDLGSGKLVDHILGATPDPEQSIAQVLQSGADLICFSGDKMLGGPQAGILLGKTAVIQSLARDPMARALRVDKLTLAALWATLAAYRAPEIVVQSNPVLAMLSLSEKSLNERAGELAGLLAKRCPGLQAQVVPTQGQVGGGAMPAIQLAGFGVALVAPGISARELEQRLRTGSTPVVARIQQDQVVLDLRTILWKDQLPTLVEAVAYASAPRE